MPGLPAEKPYFGSAKTTLPVNSRNVLYSLLAGLLLLAAAAYFRRPRPRKEPVNRHPQSLQFYAEVRCRMHCYRLTEPAVRNVLTAGVILLNRSDRRYRPCPVFTLQGETGEGRTLRIYLRQCDRQTTIIDLDLLPAGADCPCPEAKRK